MTNEWIGPYRVLSRALVGEAERLTGEAPDGRRVVLRRRGSPSGDRPAAEAVALALADHPHVATPVDVLTDDAGRVVTVTDDLGGDLLGSWLDARGRPEPGEVVTLVVPIVTAVQHLVRRGVPVAEVAVDDVEIDARGAPMVTSVVVAAAPEPGPRTGADLVPGLEVGDDAGADLLSRGLTAAMAFARSLVERADVGASPANDAAPLLDGSSFDTLVESVFDLAEAVPLSSLDGVAAGAASGFSFDAADGGRPPEHEPGDAPAPAWTAVLPESEVVDRLVAAVSRVRRGSVRAAWRSVRRRYRVLGAVGLLLPVTLVAGTAVPGPAASPGHDVASSPATDAPAAVPATPPGAARSSDGADSWSGVTDDSAADDEASASATDAVHGDDPVEAARVLLRARLSCLREPTPSCLEAVDQPGSPLAQRDAVLLDDPGQATSPSSAIEITEESSRLGGTVLLSATGPDGRPASVLVMRTEAGWRLRDVTVRG